MERKTLLILIALGLCLSVIPASIYVVASGVLAVNLGPVTVNNAPSAVIITDAVFGSTHGTVAAGGQTVSFGALTMTVGETKTLVLNVHNGGGTASTLGTPVLSGAGSSLTFSIVGGAPSSVAAGGDVTYTWNVAAVAAGSVSPSVGVSWS